MIDNMVSHKYHPPPPNPIAFERLRAIKRAMEYVEKFRKAKNQEANHYRWADQGLLFDCKTKPSYFKALVLLKQLFLARKRQLP